MPDGTADLYRLADRLREAGKEGQGLRRELLKRITEAAQGLAGEVADLEHLKPYMPDRYAAVLSGDLRVRAVRSVSAPVVTVRAQARERKRKIVLLDEGLINHPIFATGERKTWNWSNKQTGGMKKGFFSDPAERHTPEIRAKAMQALIEIAGKITS